MNASNAILSVLGAILIVVMAGCDDSNLPSHKDRLDISNSDEFKCMEVAKAEIAKQQYSYNDQANSSTDRWIYKTHFKFLQNDKDGLGFSMPGNYKDSNIYSKYSGYIPGITTRGRKSTTLINQQAPGLVTSPLAKEPTYITAVLTCMPDRKLATYVPADMAHVFKLDLPDTDPAVKINEIFGIKQVDEEFDTSFVPLDKNLKNPDGSNLVVRCYKNYNRNCWNSFLLRDGVWVVYQYPLEQLADWKQIHDFVLHNLESAIVK